MLLDQRSVTRQTVGVVQPAHPQEPAHHPHGLAGDAALVEQHAHAHRLGRRVEAERQVVAQEPLDPLLRLARGVAGAQEAADQRPAVAGGQGRLALEGGGHLAHPVEVRRVHLRVEDDPQVQRLGCDHAEQHEREHLGEQRGARAAPEPPRRASGLAHRRTTFGMNM